MRGVGRGHDPQLVRLQRLLLPLPLLEWVSESPSVRSRPHRRPTRCHRCDFRPAVGDRYLVVPEVGSSLSELLRQIPPPPWRMPPPLCSATRKTCPTRVCGESVRLLLCALRLCVLSLVCPRPFPCAWPARLLSFFLPAAKEVRHCRAGPPQPLRAQRKSSAEEERGRAQRGRNGESRDGRMGAGATTRTGGEVRKSSPLARSTSQRRTAAAVGHSTNEGSSYALHALCVSCCAAAFLAVAGCVCGLEACGCLFPAPPLPLPSLQLQCGVKGRGAHAKCSWCAEWCRWVCPRRSGRVFH
jgi:hypothetical protein